MKAVGKIIMLVLGVLIALAGIPFTFVPFMADPRLTFINSVLFLLGCAIAWSGVTLAIKAARSISPKRFPKEDDVHQLPNIF